MEQKIKEEPKVCKECGKVIKKGSGDIYLELDGCIYCEDCALTYCYENIFKTA